MARIRLEQLSKRYPAGSAALRDLSLTIDDGELLVLVGPSGSGKSTALRLIAGLEAPSSGRVFFDDEDVTATPPQTRGVAMVFQSYALYPHMNVRDNLGFGLHMRGVERARIAERVQEVARSLEIDALLDRRPAQLSGGQRQRVALGRAIVREPRVFLLDEPLSNLDAQLRSGTRSELARLHQRLGATMVYVTHDQVEAMTLGQRVAVLRDGMLQQIAPPQELYRAPGNVFVAGFIGSPPMNLLHGRLNPDGPGWRFVSADIGVEVPRLPPSFGAGEQVILGVRPHDLELADRPGAHRLAASLVERLGSEHVIHFSLPSGGELVLAAPPSTDLDVGTVAPVWIRPDAVHLFRASTGARLT